MILSKKYENKYIKYKSKYLKIKNLIQKGGIIPHTLQHSLLAAVRNEAAKEAEDLCALGQCVEALVPLHRAIDLGHLPSRALKAWLLIDGREGVVKDRKKAFQLAEEGARLGCHHCQGVIALCYWRGYGCEKNEVWSLELAHKSSVSGSKYGLLMLGLYYYKGGRFLAQDYAQAVAFYRMAAAQRLDGAQSRLGSMYGSGYGVVKDYAEALRWYQLAAIQGYPPALYMVAFCYEKGHGVPVDVAEAIRWYRRAQAVGNSLAAGDLQRLGA